MTFDSPFTESKLQIGYIWTISLELNCIIRLYKEILTL
jgi:hypothetical protein